MLIATRILPSSLALPLSLYPQQPIIHDRRCPIRRGDGSRSRANRDIPFSSIVTRTMSPLYSLSTRRNFAWLTTNGATERAEFPSPEFPRRIDRSHRPIDRSDPTRSDPIREIPRDIGAALSARGSSTARVIAIAIAVPDCDSFYREPIDRIANIDRIARSLPRVFPTFTRAPTISQLCPRLRVSPATIRTDVEGEEKNPVRRIVSPSVNHRIIDSWILIARSRSITIIYRTVTIFPSPSFDHRIFPTLGLLLLLHISCFFESNRSVLV